MKRKDPAAVSLGRRGGLAGKGRTSPAKAAAARENGRRGGRPPQYRFVNFGILERRDRRGRWRRIDPPYEASARAFVRRQK